MSGEIFPSMKSSSEEVKMCFPCFNWFEGIVCIFRYIAIIVFRYIFIEIDIHTFEIAYLYMRSATCHNLSLLGTHSISDL